MPDKGDQRRGREGIAALAQAQHGVISAAQLYALPLSRDQVSRLVGAGWLHRIHRGVYAVGHRRLARTGLWMAATLAAGPDAVLSHYSAAALWRLIDLKEAGRGRWAGPDRSEQAGVHVTRPGRGGSRRREGLVLHRSGTLRDAELTAHRGIPVTTPSRTLLDLGTVISGRPLERAVDEAERLRLCDAAQLAAILEQHRGEPGAGALGRLLRSHRPGTTLTRSELEERFVALCRDRRLPQPLVNAPLHGLTVDFLWAAERVVVEVDGRGSHDTRRGFQDDRDPDTLLAAHGYLTLRFTWHDVTRRPGVVAHRVRRVLADRGG